MRRRTAALIAAALVALVTITGVMATHFYSQQDAAVIKKLYQPYLPSDNESIVVICFDDGWKSQLNASEDLGYVWIQSDICDRDQLCFKQLSSVYELG